MRVLGDFAKKTKSTALEVRGGYLEGRLLGAEETKGLAKLPTRGEMIAMVVGQTGSPGSRLASSILAAGSRIASCIEALVEKREKEEEQGQGE
jgi:large subunit ribosomal protein L10